MKPKRTLLASGRSVSALIALIAGGVLLGGGTVHELRDPFARLGLAHVFALSGLHVGILAGLALLVLRRPAAGAGGAASNLLSRRRAPM